MWLPWLVLEDALLKSYDVGGAWAETSGDRVNLARLWGTGGDGGRGSSEAKRLPVDSEAQGRCCVLWLAEEGAVSGPRALRVSWGGDTEGGGCQMNELKLE